MSIDEMKSALADREMDLLDFHTTYCMLMEIFPNAHNNDQIKSSY